MNILDNLAKIKKLDSKNMLGSIELLGAQVKEVTGEAQKIKVPVDYKKINNVLVLGMGGSALGAHLIKTVFKNDLKVPVEIVNDYHIPNFVSKKTLVVVSSYSGTTEEPITAMQEAFKRQAKIAVISSGGMLAEVVKDKKLPALIFTTNNNPCGSPRMGLGYSTIGQIVLFSKIGLLKIGLPEIEKIIKNIALFQNKFGVKKGSNVNIIKKIALQTKNKSVWYVGAEHLSGNVHIAANQMNENAKRFAGYFIIPELNHHLMEGMINPVSNKKDLLFILLESKIYEPKIQKRFEVTKEIFKKNKIKFLSLNLESEDRLAQAMEMLIMSSYLSYYSAVVENIDPTAIPFVDFFKAKLKK